MVLLYTYAALRPLLKLNGNVSTVSSIVFASVVSPLSPKKCIRMKIRYNTIHYQRVKEYFAL